MLQADFTVKFGATNRASRRSASLAGNNATCRPSGLALESEAPHENEVVAELLQEHLRLKKETLGELRMEPRFPGIPRRGHRLREPLVEGR